MFNYLQTIWVSRQLPCTVEVSGVCRRSWWMWSMAGGKLWDGEGSAQPAWSSWGWARKVPSALWGGGEDEQSGEKGTTLACRDQEQGGTSQIQCFSLMLSLVGLGQVSVVQSQSCSACGAEGWENRVQGGQQAWNGEGATPPWSEGMFLGCFVEICLV